MESYRSGERECYGQGSGAWGLMCGCGGCGRGGFLAERLYLEEELDGKSRCTSFVLITKVQHSTKKRVRTSHNNNNI